MTGLGASKGQQRLLRGVGVRELLSGAGLLPGAQTTVGLWARVAGDAVDLGIVGKALRDRPKDRGRLAITAAVLGGVTAIDVLAARGPTGDEGGEAGSNATVTRRSVSINCTVEEAYGFWRDFTNLPRVMSHLEEVRDLGNGRSHWRAQGPGGKSVEWDAEITDDTPNRRVAWRSLPGGDVQTAGSVRFVPAPQGKGIEVHVEMQSTTPGGKFGNFIAMLVGRAPTQEVSADLREFKQLLETGEIARSDDSVRPGPNPARQSREPVLA
jgi:uncharacterized membrane protein